MYTSDSYQWYMYINTWVYALMLLLYRADKSEYIDWISNKPKFGTDDNERNKFYTNINILIQQTYTYLGSHKRKYNTNNP